MKILTTRNSTKKKPARLTPAYNPFSSEIEFYSESYDMIPFSDSDPFPTELSDTSPLSSGRVPSQRNAFINGRGAKNGFTVDLQNRLVSTQSRTNRLRSGFERVAGTNAGDTIIGNRRNNLLYSFAGNDVVVGSLGDDIISGGAGYDTLDYSGLNVSISIGKRGLITKGSRKGIDALQGDPSNPLVATIERIVGAANQANSIDASGSTSAIEVDLGTGYFNVDGITGGGINGDFDIENFVNVTGGLKDDTIIGSDRANVITGSAGNDKISGGAGYDTLDYSKLGASITLGQFGLITKGSGKGIDALQGDLSNPLRATIERIIGASKQANSIDVSGAPSDIEANLADGYLNIASVTGGGNKGDFDIENFVDVIGGFGNDTIIGNRGNNILVSGATSSDPVSDNDRISGGRGNDRIVGGSGLDDFSGGSGRDVFVLGSSTEYYYQDNSPMGNSEFATLSDFRRGLDKIVLNGDASDYVFLGTGRFKTSILRDVDSSGDMSLGDDLIASVPTGFSNRDVQFI